VSRRRQARGRISQRSSLAALIKYVPLQWTRTSRLPIKISLSLFPSRSSRDLNHPSQPQRRFHVGLFVRDVLLPVRVKKMHVASALSPPSSSNTYEATKRLHERLPSQDGAPSSDSHCDNSPVIGMVTAIDAIYPCGSASVVAVSM